MHREYSIELLESLSNASGASGFEDDVLTILRACSTELGFCERDSINNLYLSRKGNRGNRMVVQLDAHTDEVAFMVHSIMDNGLIKFIPLGGWVNCNIPAHMVRIRNDKGEYISGVVAAKPIHFMTEAEKNTPPTIDSMAIDVGASSKQEVVSDLHISIGAPIVPDVGFRYDAQRDLLFGKAFDCRAGCAAIVDTLRKLKGKELDVDVVAAFAAQEEVGTRGATVSARHIVPDVAIVFEGCPADDTFAPSYAIQTALRHGPMLRHIDARMITNPRFQRFALNLAAEQGIPVQQSVRTGGATNGAPIHLSNMGVPTIVIGLPVRYIHSHWGIMTYHDYNLAVELAVRLLSNLTEGVISGF